MSDIVLKDREQLHDRWQATCKKVFKKLAKSGVPTRVVCMHLTWYNADWKEFYSPINVLSLRKSYCNITHIVILIDDVYDMFSRLRENEHLYSKSNLEGMIDKIRKLSVPHVNDQTNDAGDPARHTVEAIESALGDLLAWRRAELVQAENIARTLGPH